MKKEQLLEVLKIDGVSSFSRINNSSFWYLKINFGIKFSDSHAWSDVCYLSLNKCGLNNNQLKISSPNLLIPLWEKLPKKQNKKIIDYFLSNDNLKKCVISDDLKFYPYDLSSLFILK